MSTRILRSWLICVLIASGASARETFPEWIGRQNVPATQRGLNDDPAGDQVANVVKFGLGLNPLLASGHLLPQAEAAVVQGGNRLVLRVPKNPDAQGVSYVVEGSSDLSHWSSAGMIVVADTPTLLTVADAVSLDTADRRFLRVRVTVEDPIPGTLTWSQVAAIQAVLDQAIAAYQIPGIVYSVKVPGQEPWTDGRGVRDLGSGESISPAGRFRIGSASKTFVGMAALRLIGEHKLGLEHNIAHYLPADVLSNYRKDLITIRMLLQHTSGINNYTNLIEEWFLPYILDRKRVWTNEQLVALVNAHFADPAEAGGKEADPGQKWYYSNTNTILLAMIIEKVTGMGIGQYITQHFIQPLGLRDTFYPAPGETTIPAPFIRGYMDWVNFTGESSLPPGLIDVTEYDPTGVGPAGPMISSVRDLGLWMEAIARNDQLIGDYRAGHIDWRYFTAFSTSATGPRSGSYGFKLAHEPDRTNNADYNIIGHRGQISGYDTSMMYLPEPGVSIVVVCTRTLKFDEGFPTNASEAALSRVVGLLFPQLIAANQIPASHTEVRKLQSMQTRKAVRHHPLAEYP